MAGSVMIVLLRWLGMGPSATGPPRTASWRRLPTCRRRLLEVMPLDGDAERLGPGAGSQFVHRAGHVGLDGPLGEAELAPDLLARQSLGDQAEDVALPLAERADDGTRGRRSIRRTVVAG